MLADSQRFCAEAPEQGATCCGTDTTASTGPAGGDVDRVAGPRAPAHDRAGQLLRVTTTVNVETKDEIVTAIRVFEPALCCNTGVCGPDVDQSLVTFTADLGHLTRHWTPTSSRHNLANDPQAFAGNDTVRAFLRVAGSEGPAADRSSTASPCMTGSLPRPRATAALRRPAHRHLYRRCRPASSPRASPRSASPRNPATAAVRRGAADDDRAEVSAGPAAVRVLHRQGRCRQDLDRLRHRAAPGPPRQAGAAGQHRPGLQRRPGPRRHHRQHRHRPSTDVPGLSALEIDPGAGRRRLPRTHHRARSAGCCRTARSPPSPSNCPGRAPPRSPRSTSSPTCSPIRA